MQNNNNPTVKYLLFAILILLVIVTIGGAYYLGLTQSENKSGNPQTISIGKTSSSQSLERKITTDTTVGGDRDEHGCIGSAGYSWCGAKNKCIRIWEEDCQSLEKIRQALVTKDNLTDDATVSIEMENAEYAKGSISFEEGIGGGIFLAAKINDKWQIVFSGNGSIDCQTIKSKYQFPLEMLKNFCD